MPEELAQLREIFGFHPLAMEDTEHFDQRPKLDDYQGVPITAPTATPSAVPSSAT